MISDNGYKRMSKQESISIPRSRIFVLDDSTFVVQWEENRVQELLNGRYRPYDESQFGNAITDFELNQLVRATVVEHYDDELVSLSSLSNIMPEAPSRVYYLNTTLSSESLKPVQDALQTLGLADELTARLRYDFVVIWKKDGAAFYRFDDAERNRENLILNSPDLFGDTVVSFVEILPIR